MALFVSYRSLRQSIGETNALFVATLPGPSGVRQCLIAAEAAATASSQINRLTYRWSLSLANSKFKQQSEAQIVHDSVYPIDNH